MPKGKAMSSSATQRQLELSSATISLVTSTVSSSSGKDFQASVGTTPSPFFPGCDDPDPDKEVLLYGYTLTSMEDCDGQVDVTLWKMDPVRKPPIHLFRVGRAEESPTWTASPRTTS